MRVCTICNIEKEINEFRKRNGGQYYYHQCKNCMNGRKRQRNASRKPQLEENKRVIQIQNGEELAKKYVGMVVGSFTITKYLGRMTLYNEIYERYYFEKTCNFCGDTKNVNPHDIKQIIKKNSKCVYCKCVVNIHTNEKRCNICKIWKPATNEYFHKSNSRRFNLDYYCIECKNELHRKRRECPVNNAKEYAQKKRRYHTDDLFKLTCRIKSNIKNTILYHRLSGTEWKKKSKTTEILQCDFKTFKEHIENQFEEGMFWDNYGAWHFEHTIPSSYGETIEEVQELCHYMNYRPMWGGENQTKGNKLYINSIPDHLKIRYEKFISRYINSNLVRDK